MRVVLVLLLAMAAVPVAAAPVTYAQFDKSIARTKQAMMGDPAQALASANAAVALAATLPPARRSQIAMATAQWLHGEALIGMNQVARARPIIEGALRLVERFDPNTKLHGDLLRSHGSIAASTGHTLEALHDYQRAHEVFQAAGEARSRALALQDIGLIYSEAGDYDRALRYYDQSAEAFGGDATLTLITHNNRAEVFRKQKRYADAAAAYRAALVQARKLDSRLLQTRILTNLAAAEADAGTLASAQTTINQALSLATHGEAAGWRAFAFGIAARIASQRGDLPRATQLITRTFAGVDLRRSDMMFRDYHQIAANVFEAAGDERQALAHLKAFQRLEGEAQTLTASAASQLVAARFDFASQNLKISRLTEGQLKRDIQIERQKSSFRTTLFGGLLGAGGIVLSLLLFSVLSFRRSRNEVRDANTSLSQSNSALEIALKAKTEFLATTSHEIRTPLNGILGMTQVLLADRRVDADIRERIEVVHGAGETMRALVDDILDVAKMESGALTVAREPTDLAAILLDVARLWSGQAEAKGLDLKLEIDAAPARILSDGGRLRQIAFNLMSNALKFTSAGGVTLSAHAEALDEGEQLVIRVTDTGIGIPADKQAEIFEAFRQVDGGVTRQFGGTGLGLAICRNLAVALGGDIDVASVPGEGATFTVRLPLERAGSEPCGDRAMAGRESLADARMLIVERDPAVRGLLQVLLAAEVGSIEAAAGAEDALAALAAGGIDHVVADAGSVVGDDEPLPALRALVAAARAAGARLTLLLTPGDRLAIADAMMAGATQLVVKPIAAADLQLALASLYGEEPASFVAPALLDRQAA